MIRTLKSHIIEVVKGCGIAIACFMAGGLMGGLIQEIDWSMLNSPNGYDGLRSDLSDLNRETIDDYLIHVEGDNLSEEEKAKLNWLYKSKKFEVEKEEVSEQLAILKYQVKLVQDLTSIPVDYRTPTLQQQLLQGSEYVILDSESKTIWCEYDAPDYALTKTILSIE